MEFLVEIEVRLPAGLEPGERDRLLAAEASRGTELAREGVLRAIWRVPGRFANCAIWSAPDATVLHSALTSLPLWPYLDVEVTALARHDLAGSCPGIPAGQEVS